MKFAVGFLGLNALFLLAYLIAFAIFGIIGFYVAGVLLVILTVGLTWEAVRSGQPYLAVLVAIASAFILMPMASAASNAPEMTGYIAWLFDFGARLDESGANSTWGAVLAFGSMIWLVGGFMLVIWSFDNLEAVKKRRINEGIATVVAFVIVAWGLTGGSLLGWLLGTMTHEFVS